MTTEARQHLKKEILVGGLSNTVFNGLIAWLLLKDGEPLSWSGSNSFVVDIFATAFILPFIVALIVIPMHKRKIAKGTMPAMNFGPGSRLQSWVNRLPASTFANACCFGLIGICLAAPPPLIVFQLAGIEQIAPVNYAIFKGVWAGLMAGFLV
ncbi:MAG: hypothetical protein V7746_26140, partial [Halioglobus sp.]